MENSHRNAHTHHTAVVSHYPGGQTSSGNKLHPANLAPRQEKKNLPNNNAILIFPFLYSEVHFYQQKGWLVCFFIK